jgi:hypothetical protein
MHKSWRARLVESDLWQAWKAYLGARRPGKGTIADRADLAEFISTRAAHVAQTSLYGYLRTRAGSRYPELFADERFLESINIAKWHVWLACVSDLALYAGALLACAGNAHRSQVGSLVLRVVDDILAETGVPADGGPDFAAHASAVRTRLSDCEWSAFVAEDAAVTESPAALVEWAPVMDELKRLDEEIVRNSVRFRWSEVRRDLRRYLDCNALIASAGSAAPEAIR